MKNMERLPIVLSYIRNAESIVKELYYELGVRKKTQHGRMANVAATDLSAARRLLEAHFGTNNTSDSNAGSG